MVHFITLSLFLVAPELAFAMSGDDPFSPILLTLASVAVLGLLARALAIKLNQASVLGELLLGVAIGNLGLHFHHPLSVLIMDLSHIGAVFQQALEQGVSLQSAALKIDAHHALSPNSIGAQALALIQGPGASFYVVLAWGLWVFSNLGVLFLLFMVGLESRVQELLRVGPRAGAVALVGVAAPIALTYGVSLVFLPEAPVIVHYFLAAAACATSVGITARVLRDLGQIQAIEAKIILGAAVIDDVLGLIILAVVANIAASGTVDSVVVFKAVALSGLFLGLILAVGDRFVRWVIPLFTRLDQHNAKLLFPVALCMLLALAANFMGLATIIGAFAAGLIINDEYFARHSKNHTHIREIVAPLETLFAPAFFILMGMQVNLATFTSPTTLGLALAISVAAIVGKWVSGLAAGPTASGLTVGLGMVPRGEVGLIFAGLGKSLGALNDEVFSAVVVMVIVTTLITPTSLAWALRRQSAQR